jgi:alcohol dehydrogenase class IV
MARAKAIGIVCTNDRHVLEFEGVETCASRAAPGLRAHTAGTGPRSPSSPSSLDTKRKVKIAIVSNDRDSDAALVDRSHVQPMDPESRPTPAWTP